MRKLKYLLLIIVVLLFSGCSGDYNLNLNKDLTVDEELVVVIDNTNDNYEKTYQLFEKANIDEKDYEILVIDEGIKITYNRKYSSFQEYYLESNLYKMLFEDIEFTKDNKGMSISTKSNLKLDDKGNSNIINSYDIDDFNINLKVPFSVQKNNADSIKNNVYTWALNKDDTYKEINIKFEYTNDNARSIVMLVLVGIGFLAIIIYLVSYFRRNQRI